ncbi:hypothetical protein CEXT_118371 [Caerostris extrusa]|uniref:Uncharacterized protein n=1 Tax=Caerostris extrusa TaxID=172846 RepID=A0AAV4UFS6_CAEEX|nr:hypothetical protein CEXT_118371 [Caerostris extrusa]
MRKDQQKNAKWLTAISRLQWSPLEGEMKCVVKGRESHKLINCVLSDTQQKPFYCGGIQCPPPYILLHKTRCFSSSVGHPSTITKQTLHSLPDAHKDFHPPPSQHPHDGIFPSFALFHAIIVCRKVSSEKAGAMCIMHLAILSCGGGSFSLLQFLSIPANGHP